jgi:hypothetical protein
VRQPVQFSESNSSACSHSAHLLCQASHQPEAEFPVFLLAALFIFASLSASAWFLSVALFKSTFDGPHPALEPSYSTTAACAIGAVTLTCFAPFPAGYIAGIVAWAVAVYGFLGLSIWRATVLVGYLAAASMVTRMVVLGVLDFTR